MRTFAVLAIALCVAAATRAENLDGIDVGEHMSLFQPMTGKEARKLLAPGDKCITFINECPNTPASIAISYVDPENVLHTKGWFNVQPQGGSQTVCWTGSPNAGVHIDLIGDRESSASLGDSDTTHSTAIGEASGCVASDRRFQIVTYLTGSSAEFEEPDQNTGRQSSCSALGTGYQVVGFNILPDVETSTISCS